MKFIYFINRILDGNEIVLRHSIVCINSVAFVASMQSKVSSLGKMLDSIS